MEPREYHGIFTIEEQYLCSWVEVFSITLAPSVSSYISFISVPLAEHKSI